MIMPSPSQPWSKSLDDLELDVALLHNTTSSGRSTPTPDERRQMDPYSIPPLSRSASESQIGPVASSSTQSTPPLPALARNVPEVLSHHTTPLGTPRPSFIRHPRPATYRSQGSSPLNPSSPPQPFSPFARPVSHPSALIQRIPSEESRALSIALPSPTNLPSRGSMILYRRADTQDNTLLPPAFPNTNRNSVISTSGESFVSLSADSKYPAGMVATERGLVAYAFDPFLDDQDPNEDDPLHDPDGKMFKSSGHGVSFRGLKNLTTLLLLLAGLLALFVVYPVFRFFHDNNRNLLIVENTRINSTGQAVVVDVFQRSQIPILIADATPLDVRLRTGSDGEQYELVFSDEFNVDGRSFYESNDLFWEVDDHAPNDRHQIYTQNGYLVINANAMSSSVTLRLRYPFCLSNGFVEVGVVSPEGAVRKRIYWSGTWTFSGGESAIVPQGSSLMETVPLDLRFIAGRSRSTSSASGNVMMDYVRVYQSNTRTTSSCEGVPQRARAFLDISHLF